MYSSCTCESCICLDVKFVQNFSPEYFRNNKTGKAKNLRCFPICDLVRGHSDHTFCGEPVKVQFSFLSTAEARGQELCKFSFVGELQSCDEQFSPISEPVYESFLFQHSQPPTNIQEERKHYFIRGKQNEIKFEKFYEVNGILYWKYSSLIEFRSVPWQYVWQGNRHKHKTLHSFVVSVFSSECWHLNENGKRRVVDDCSKMRLVKQSCSPKFSISSVRRKKPPVICLETSSSETSVSFQTKVKDEDFYPITQPYIVNKNEIKTEDLISVEFNSLEMPVDEETDDLLVEQFLKDYSKRPELITPTTTNPSILLTGTKTREDPRPEEVNSLRRAELNVTPRTLSAIDFNRIFSSPVQEERITPLLKSFLLDQSCYEMLEKEIRSVDDYSKNIENRPNISQGVGMDMRPFFQSISTNQTTAVEPFSYSSYQASVAAIKQANTSNNHIEDVSIHPTGPNQGVQNIGVQQSNSDVHTKRLLEHCISLFKEVADMMRSNQRGN